MIYFSTFAGLYALNPDGTQRWFYPGVGSISSPAIGADGTIYIGDDELFAIRPDGDFEMGLSGRRILLLPGHPGRMERFMWVRMITICML